MTPTPQPPHPICRECQSELWCRNNGCIPVRDEVEPAVERAIADLCNPSFVHLAVSTLTVPSAYENQTLRLVATAAHTVQETPL